VNKDEMSDDAQFDAFLKGEGDLSRQLQSLAQPSPSAALDAAILERARLAIAGQGREAANDPGTVPHNNSSLARGLGMRWRVPAGIAAAVLAGLIGQQAFQQADREQLESVSADVAPVRSVEPPAAPAVMETAPPDTPAPKPLPAPEYKMPPAETVSAPAPAPVAVPSPPPEPVAVTRPAPAPMPAPPPPPQQARPVSEGAALSYAPSPASASAPPRSRIRAAGEGASDFYARANTQKAAKSSLERVTVTGSSIKREQLHEAPEWLALMEDLLQKGKDVEAAHEWARFRRTYPDHAVPEALEQRLKSLPAKNELY
jgi:hypothetical protein